MVYVIRLTSGPWFGDEDIETLGVFGPFDKEDLETFLTKEGLVRNDRGVWEKHFPVNRPGPSITATVIPVNPPNLATDLLSGNEGRHWEIELESDR